MREREKKKNSKDEVEPSMKRNTKNNIDGVVSKCKRAQKNEKGEKTILYLIVSKYKFYTTKLVILISIMVDSSLFGSTYCPSS